ncbi:MAG: bifunctional DNA-formamidopyrimidine glycosylase/DNA-(apurinic or apyrimidinic site) lyase [Lautropia sp.]|nr:bifunctional DNA-formamidopyrimidine glycosylase/DNA-(apurinic or apyrimidinic site) lyase [Lautropia sp.]
MPELPEVEVVGRGVSQAFVGRSLTGVVRRCEQLRWPVPADLLACIGTGAVLQTVVRRGKYLLLGFERGTVLLHLGMSGSLLHLPADTPARRHDHLDLVFGERLLRLHDPRRFGAVLWSAEGVQATQANHPLLMHLGVEPLTPAFTAARFFRASRGRSVAIKQYILSGQVVIGVGNIYVSESLFRARIHPATPAGALTETQCRRLVREIRTTLTDAIAAGGSSLKDFVDSRGEGGYFQLQHRVYGRANLPCLVCGTSVMQIRQQGRSTFFCPKCQPLIG